MIRASEKLNKDVSPKIRVLVVDDSAIVRKLFVEELSRYPDIEVVGTAPDPYVARDKVVALKPDVLTLDVEMPRMDGITFLRKLMRYYPLPVVIVSALTQAGSQMALDALESGAVDVIGKPGSSFTVGELSVQLAEKIRAAAQAKRFLLKSRPKLVVNKPGSAATRPKPCLDGGVRALSKTTDQVIAVGASTGGTSALRDLVSALEPTIPGMVVVQHMPEQFTKTFAVNLDSISRLEVKEAVDGDVIRMGRVLIAPGNRHLVVTRSGARYLVRIKDGPLVCHQRPSVDVLFHSVAKVVGRNAVGVILTGMGRDGAEGMLKMKEAGSRNIAQDEDSCVVFGMPKEAIKTGAVDTVAPLSKIPRTLVSMLK